MPVHCINSSDDLITVTGSLARRHHRGMTEFEQLTDRIFGLQANGSFEEAALEVFRYQYVRNEVYRRYCDLLGRAPAAINRIEKIPFLPVELFKSHRVVSFNGPENHVFTSSATTGSVPSSHFVYDMTVYERSFMEGFRLFYGAPSCYCVLALLPGYLERKGSSLVYMADRLIRESGHADSGFYLDDLDGLALRLKRLMESGTRVLLLGVSFALLDFAEKHPMPLRNAIVMETGGMKGRRREMTRKELHENLCKAFQQESIHSEYGMTELFSQAYSMGSGRFECPPWMRVLIRDSNDPLEVSAGLRGGKVNQQDSVTSRNEGAANQHEAGTSRHEGVVNFYEGSASRQENVRRIRSGGINVVDLANIQSCSFLATEDLGRLYHDGTFEVLGRFDHSEVRGCNLMA